MFSVPVNLKDRDAFHISIEEYLQSLITLIEELARLAINSVTLGDYQRPLQISQFVKDLHAGFQILNLKNDSLRRRSDSIKYNVKKIEDIVYDLSLRNLVPKAGSTWASHYTHGVQKVSGQVDISDDTAMSKGFGSHDWRCQYWNVLGILAMSFGRTFNITAET
jgi:Translin family